MGTEKGMENFSVKGELGREVRTGTGSTVKVRKKVAGKKRYL